MNSATEPPASTVRDLLIAAARELATTSDSPRLDAEVLMAALLQTNRTALLTSHLDSVNLATVEAFRIFVERRVKSEPVAYITGKREFWGIEFAVGPGVLSPRPETEFLVENVVKHLSINPALSLLEVGVGSGAIILSIAASVPGHRGLLVGGEISPAALEWADRNRSLLGLRQRVHLVLGDLAKWTGARFDLILANLPYLTIGQISSNPQLAAEPRLALDGGDDGLDLIRTFLSSVPRLLAHGGRIGLEIDPSQAHAVGALATEFFPTANVIIQQDLAGLDRHFWICTS